MTMEDTRRSGRSGSDHRGADRRSGESRGTERRGTERRGADRRAGASADAAGTRPGGRSTSVVRPDEEQPLGNISGRVREGVGTWLRSPALDFYGLLVIGALLIAVGLVMVLATRASPGSSARAPSPRSASCC
jgi:hypothetical protein